MHEGDAVPSPPSLLKMAVVPLTLILQVAQVQDGSQELRDLPVLRVREHEHLHGRADVGVLQAVLAALTGYAVTLVGRGGRRGARGCQGGQSAPRRSKAWAGEPSLPSQASLGLWTQTSTMTPPESLESSGWSSQEDTAHIWGAWTPLCPMSKKSRSLMPGLPLSPCLAVTAPSPHRAPLPPETPTLRNVNPHQVQPGMEEGPLQTGEPPTGVCPIVCACETPVCVCVCVCVSKCASQLEEVSRKACHTYNTHTHTYTHTHTPLLPANFRCRSPHCVHVAAPDQVQTISNRRPPGLGKLVPTPPGQRAPGAGAGWQQWP